jgi:hypothetical protein
MWKIINRETGKHIQTHNIIIKQGYNLITNPRIIADSFNRYFMNVAENVSLNRDKGNIRTTTQPQEQRYTTTMFAAPVTEKEMEEVILS